VSGSRGESGEEETHQKAAAALQQHTALPPPPQHRSTHRVDEEELVVRQRLRLGFLKLCACRLLDGALDLERGEGSKGRGAAEVSCALELLLQALDPAASSCISFIQLTSVVSMFLRQLFLPLREWLDLGAPIWELAVLLRNVNRFYVRSTTRMIKLSVRHSVQVVQFVFDGAAINPKRRPVCAGVCRSRRD